MLYDPKWEKPQIEPQSLLGLAIWLGTKDPNETYEYWYEKCLVHQYMNHLNIPKAEQRAVYAQILGEHREVAYEEPLTFGAARKRALDAIAAERERALAVLATFPAEALAELAGETILAGKASRGERRTRNDWDCARDDCGMAAAGPEREG